MTQTAATQTIDIPAQTIEVLTAPMTYAQYLNHPSVGDDRIVTAVVSVDFDKVFESDYDTNVDYFGPLVVSELGEDWTISATKVVGVDRRPAQAESGQRILVEISLYPGAEESVGVDDTWADPAVRSALASLSPLARPAIEKTVEEALPPLRRLGHRPAIATPITLDTDSDTLEIVLLCMNCDGCQQLEFDATFGALGNDSVDGGFNSTERCPGA